MTAGFSPVALRIPTGAETVELTVDDVLSDIESDEALEKLVRFGAAALGLTVSASPDKIYTPV
jgi:hypothetical protein